MMLARAGLLEAVAVQVVSVPGSVACSENNGRGRNVRGVVLPAAYSGPEFSLLNAIARTDIAARRRSI